MPDEPVFGVEGSTCRGMGGGLAVCRTHDDPAVKGLEPPAAADEFAREPVEQRGMDRFIALGAKIVGGSRQPLAEMVLPDPVDGDPRQQAAGPLLDAGEPFGQRGALIGRAGRFIGGILDSRAAANAALRGLRESRRPSRNRSRPGGNRG